MFRARRPRQLGASAAASPSIAGAELRLRYTTRSAAATRRREPVRGSDVDMGSPGPILPRCVALAAKRAVRRAKLAGERQSLAVRLRHRSDERLHL